MLTARRPVGTGSAGGYKAGQGVDKRRALDGTGAEADQMRAGHLTVDELKPPLLQVPGKGDKPRFRGITGTTEHGFAKKYLSQSDAIEPAHQRFTLPDFHRMGDAQPV